MTISPQDISRWSQRGDPIHAWYSYEMVRESLTPARLGDMTVSVYPQGSYANKTNIVGDSDVDLVVSLKSAFYPDMTKLSPHDRDEYARYYEHADRTWHDFRDIVSKVLRGDFSIVRVGSKAITVSSGLIRLPADVLIALDHRDYKSFPSFDRQDFVEGVQFYASGKRKVINFPISHMHACKDKDRRTSGNFRRVVRVAKNARNALVADDESPITSRTAPSYFLESLLWNVPSQCFKDRVGDAYQRSVRWLQDNRGALAGLKFPHRMGKLFGETADTSWTQPMAKQIIEGLYGQLPS